MTTIETRDLSVTLEGRTILEHIHITAGKQQIIGIIGPNGSGKSTLLKCIYRVLQPTGGAVLLEGRELRSYSARQSAQKLAVVAQHHATNFDLTVLEVVLMGRSPHKHLMENDNAEDYRIAREALHTVGMAEQEERVFSTLSGGEQQRVILARALTQQTPCLILDEPTNHLDIQYQLQMMALLRSIDRTVILAVHDLNLAASYCDYLYALQNGRLAGSGPPRTLLTSDFIERVYHVQARVGTDEDGFPYVVYRPLRKENPI